MSEQYEAVVVVSTQSALSQSVITLGINTPLETCKLSPHVYAFYPAQPRRTIDDALMPHIAREISKRVGQAVAVIYDNQIGLRSAYLYENGAFIRDYGEDDELWVLLDEDGEPQANGPTFHIHELVNNQEYDCLVSAIDMGLRAIGIGEDVSSQGIKQALCYPLNRA